MTNDLPEYKHEYNTFVKPIQARQDITTVFFTLPTLFRHFVYPPALPQQLPEWEIIMSVRLLGGLIF